MTKKKLEETKRMLEVLKNGRTTTEQMSEDDCFAIYGISRTQAIRNVDAAITKYEREIQRAEHPLTGIDKKLFEIAAKHLITVQERGDLETRHSDSEDFIEVSVGGLEAALKDAYEAGRKSK
jgi:hypothetical protein